MKYLVKSLSITFCFLLFSVAGAQDIIVEADISELDPSTGKHRLSGNVVATQGATTLKAEQILLTTVDGEITQIAASGSPATMSSLNDFLGQASSINYDVNSKIAIFKGDALVKRSDESMSGEEITANLETDYLYAKGQGDKRVKLTFSSEK